MAFEATTQLYQREANLLNARAQQQYDTYLADLARNFGIAEGGLNANLEGRGILRSGEASTARTRLAAENQALKSKAMQDLEYQKNMNQINLLKQLASLQANSNQQATDKSQRFSPEEPKYPAVPPARFRQPYAPQKTINPQTQKPIASSEDRRVSFSGR